MAWKKQFSDTLDRQQQQQQSVFAVLSENRAAYRNYQSTLPEVYIGHPNRVERYNQYEQMDMDSEISAALEIISEFCTQRNVENGTAFDIQFKEQPTDTEITIIKEQLKNWVSLNQFDRRLFKLFRNVLKYGDQLFVRDPETFKLFWVEMSKVVKVIVNENEGKKPEQYVLSEINPNFQNLTMTAISTSDTFANHPQVGGPSGAYVQPRVPYSGGNRFSVAANENAIAAEHVVHISLTEGLDVNWPFGNSILEKVFKVFKQKELLEDAILIYRIQRAPERRVFKIDVGDMPSHMAMAYVERVKNEIHQRRIPTQTGGGATVMDATYNPMSTLEDYFFPVTADGRGSSVDVMQGGCLAMDTRVSLLDGRELTIGEIETEMKMGKKLWTYSCQPVTGKIVPGLITWAGVTQKSAQVLKITLDNGEHIIVTPDHKFPVYDKEFKRAEEFKIGDSLIPLYRRKETLHNRRDYEQLFDNLTKEWIYTHRLVADYLKDTEVSYFVYDTEVSNGKYEVRHHKDFNRFNNSPENLCWMSWADHSLYHSDNSGKKMLALKDNNPEEYAAILSRISQGVRAHYANMLAEDIEAMRQRGKDWWSRLSSEERAAQAEKMGNGVKKYIQSLSAEELATRAKNSRDAFVIANKVFNNLMNTDIEFRHKVISKRMLYWTEENRQIRGTKTSKSNYEKWNSPDGEIRKQQHSASQTAEYSHEMLLFVINLVKGKTSHQVSLDDVVDALNSNEHLIDQFAELNKLKNLRNRHCAFTSTSLTALVNKFGYNSWSDFRRKESVHNHRIVNIEHLPDQIEVGTLTIDGDETYHNYHTFALSAGVMTFNSNLGEIDDLKFFTNKLNRGLGIPSSYLPTGADEGAQVYNDGKVGTALIQEWRFNQTCKRLQELVCHTLDTEFKMFMRWRGLNIDNGLFEIKFNEPQNFSKYRQIEIDNARIQGFQQLEQVPYLSKRFMLKRYLGLSEEEMLENEQLWKEEHADDIHAVAAENSNIDLRAAGITPDNIATDIENTEAALEPPPTEPTGEISPGIAPQVAASPAPAPGTVPTPSPVP